MKSSHLVIFSTSGKVITKFNVLRCIILSETPFWTGAMGRIAITLNRALNLYNICFTRVCSYFRQPLPVKGCQTGF